MDFSFSEDTLAVRELIGQIFEDHCGHERSRDIEHGDAWFDEALWQELVKSNLAGITVPEDFGGAGMGLIEACVMLEQVGKYCAPVPLQAALILGAMPVAEFGSQDQKKRLLPAAAESGALITAALAEVGLSNPAKPRVTATRQGDGWVLEGVKTGVPAAGKAACILVPAATGDGTVGVFLIDPEAEGVSIEEQQVINWERQGLLRLSGVKVSDADVLGDPAAGAQIVDWIVDRALLGNTAVMVGLAEEATRRTAIYMTERRQFDRPLGTFQGVQLRTADAYIDTEAMRAVLWQAAWRTSEGLRAGAEVRVAKWWAARAGDRIVHSVQHLHGGIGADQDYPIHRYFLWAQQLMVTLGGSNQQLAELGKLLVSDDLRPSF
jgi:alkylation response protein AidB-like acyl-CoA dehydrogenase